MLNYLSSEDLWNAIERAAKRLLPQPLALDVVSGLLGTCITRTDEPLYFADLQLEVLPGLEGLAIQPLLHPLPTQPTPSHLLKLRGKRCKLLLVFAQAEEHDPPIDPETEEPFPPPGPYADAPLLMLQELSLDLEKEAVYSLTTRLKERSSESLPLFFFLLSFRRASSRGPLAAHLLKALQRLAAFSVAFPNRLFTLSPLDSHKRQTLCTFLYRLAGKKKHKLANRLRWAAEALEKAKTEADKQEALYWLYEAACLSYHLAPSAEEALLSPPLKPIPPLQQKELLYLVRAGTAELRTLAAARISAARGQQSWAASALEPLRFDRDPRVRAIAIRSVGSST